MRSVLGAGASTMIATVISIYLSDSPLLLEALRGALETQDPEGLGRASHSLKSSSANLGANVLAGLCWGWKKSRDPFTQGAEDLIRRVEANIGWLKRPLRRY